MGLLLPGCALHGAGRRRVDVIALSDRYTSAYKRRDWAAVDSLIGDDYVGTGVGMVWNRDSLRLEFPQIRLIAYERRSALVTPLTPDIVLLSEDGFLNETVAGQEISGSYRFTTVWARRAGTWRLVFEQEVPVPKTQSEPSKVPHD